MPTRTPPPPAGPDGERWFTKKQAAALAQVDEKTVQRALPTEENQAHGRVRLHNARRDGDGANAPWLIPGTDLVAAGLVAAADLEQDGGATGEQALIRQRDDRELTRLREQNAAYLASDQIKTALLADRDTEIARLRAEIDRLLDIVAGAVRSGS